MKPSEDPWAAPASSGQPEPPARPPTPAAGHTGEEPGPWARSSAPDDLGPGGHAPADAASSATCYLLHFDHPYVSANGKGMAKHYSGWAARSKSLKSRLADHEHGRGARLLQVVKAAGITWKLARTWPGGRDRERQLKNQGGASRRCPECGVNPRSYPAERKETAAMRQPEDREAGQVQGPSQPRERTRPSWVRAQLAAQIQRSAAAPVQATPAAERQSRELDTPQLPDLEAEP
jgi:hypothetical protein